MTPAIQDTLLQLFEHVRHDPETLPTVPVDRWQEGSVEWRLLSGFSSMMEQVQQRMFEFKQTEEQLREREEQYRSVFEATDDELSVNDLDGYYVEANPAYCWMLKYTHEELIGLNYSQTTYPKYYSVLDESARAIQAGGQFQVQGLARRKDGSPLPVEAHATPFTYKGKRHVLGVMRDITERVEAEKQLREREEQYRSIFEATYDALFIIDLDGYIVEVNPAYCSMFGYTQEVIGMHASALTLPAYLPGLDEALKTVKTGETFQSPAIVQCPRKDGTVFYAEAQSTTLTFRGKPHALGVVRDITKRVQAEQQLREKEEQLMQLRFPLKNLGLIWETITSSESIIMQNMREETPLTRAFRVAMGELGETTFHYVRACMMVPLSLRDQVIGMLVLTSSEEQAFTQHHATLALAIANQAAVAIENARLYAQAQELAAVEERQRLARELHDSVSQALMASRSVCIPPAYNSTVTQKSWLSRWIMYSS